MTKQITLEEALELVSFCHVTDCHGDAWAWGIHTVNGTVNGDIRGDVGGNVNGNIYGDVDGDIYGKINGRNWEFIETPKDKLQRLITESGNQELIEAFNQMENN